MRIFNKEKFIGQYITLRENSLFEKDIQQNRSLLEERIGGKSALVIGGAGTIGSSFIRALLRFKPARIVVFDINENELTELVRDVRSTAGMYVPTQFLTYPLDFSSPVAQKIMANEGPFDIVANFAAHKHVRSEKDHYSIEAMIENNVLKAKVLLDYLSENPPSHFFCVSTDKAANPVNVMGASKKLMEDVIMSYAHRIPITTARFANVAFSNGSLLHGFIERLFKQQPLSAPADVKRYFVSPRESGELCMLACVLGAPGDIFFPKLKEEEMKTFAEIAVDFLKVSGFTAHRCKSEEEAKTLAVTLTETSEEYPVYFFNSDTSGEKAFEEFFTIEETLDLDSYLSLGVVKETPRKDLAWTQAVMSELNELFRQEKLEKQAIVNALQSFIPGFNHLETGKSLDQRM